MNPESSGQQQVCRRLANPSSVTKIWSFRDVPVHTSCKYVVVSKRDCGELGTV